MKLLCLLASLLLHSLFLIKFDDGEIHREIVSTAREVITIKVKGIKKIKSSLSKKRKTKSVQKKINNQSVSNTRLIEAQSKSTIKPIYPERARLLGLSGKATVMATIDAIGNVLNVRLTESSGYDILDIEIIRSVKEALFVAATQNGVAVQSEKKITFNYELE